jgi:group I intron endonuclease
MGYIYKITNKINNKCYIGESQMDNIEDRWRSHLRTFRTGKRGCPALKSAVTKYGIENFKFEILIICFNESCFEMEKMYIKKYNSLVPNGYNISPGGQFGTFKGWQHTEETKKKISEKVRSFNINNPDWYETIREKHAALMAKVDTGSAVKNSEKFQKARAEGRVGSAGWKNKEITPNIRNKVSKSLTEYFSEGNNIEKHRKSMAAAVGIQVKQYDLSNNLMATYESIAEASRITSIKRSSIWRAIGISKSGMSNGFIWRK